MNVSRSQRRLRLRLLALPAFLCGCVQAHCAWAQLPAASAPHLSVIIGARQPALTADGKSLAFSLHGDVWRCTASGGVAERVTVHPAYDGYPAWSPDGKWIAFSSNREGRYDVYVMPAAGGTPRRITFHPSDDYVCDWSPDGAEVLFESLRAGEVPNLYCVSVAGGNVRRLTFEPLGARFGRYSPDGATVVYGTGNRQWWQARYREGAFSEIRSIAVTGGRPKALAGGEGYMGMPGFTRVGLYWVQSDDRAIGIRKWSGTGKDGVRLEHPSASPISWFACARNADVIVFDREGRLYRQDLSRDTQPTPIEASAPSDTRSMTHRTERRRSGFKDLSLSPDGKQVAFIAGGDVWTAPIDGGDATRLTATAGPERSPAWSPDGKRIAYVAVRGDRTDLFESVVETRKETQLTNDPEEEAEPGYSPEGRRIAFAVGLRNEWQLRVVYLDAPPSEPLGNLTTLARSFEILGYDWSPDGRWLVYAGASGADVRDLYVVPSAGGAGVNVTRSAGRLERPSWSRSGTMIAAIGAIWERDGSRERRGVVVVDLQPSSRTQSEPMRPGQGGPDIAATPASDEPIAQRPRRGPAPRQQGGPSETATPPGLPWPFGAPVRPAERVMIDLARAHERIRLPAQVPGSVRWLTFGADGRSLALVVTSSDGASIAGADSLSPAAIRLAAVPAASHASVLPDSSALVFLDDRGAIRLLRRGSQAAGTVGITCTYDSDQRQVVREAVAEIWREVARLAGGVGGQQASLRGSLEVLATASDAHQDLATTILATAGQIGQVVREASVLQAETDRSGFLGLDFNAAYRGSGLLISHVVADGPSDRIENAPAVGEYVHSVNEVPCTTPEAVWIELQGLAGKDVRMVVAPSPPSGEAEPAAGKRTVTVRAISQEEERRLRHREDDERAEALVARLGSSTVAYVRLRDLSSNSLRRLASALVSGRDSARSVVLDLRDLRSDDDAASAVALLLSGDGGPRTDAGAEASAATSRRKPVVLLINELTEGSAGDVAEAFHAAARGPIVGAPTSGWNGTSRAVQILDGIRIGLAESRYRTSASMSRPGAVVKPTEHTVREPDKQLAEAVAEALRVGEVGDGSDADSSQKPQPTH